MLSTYTHESKEINRCFFMGMPDKCSSVFYSDRVIIQLKSFAEKSIQAAI